MFRPALALGGKKNAIHFNETTARVLTQMALAKVDPDSNLSQTDPGTSCIGPSNACRHTFPVDYFLT